MDTARPITVKAAAGLLIFAYVSGLPLTPVAMLKKPGTYVALAFIGGLLFLKVWSIYTRRNWGRWLIAVLFVFGLFGTYTTSTQSSPRLVIAWAQTFLILVAVILLFTPQSNRWFQQQPPPQS
jgi:hypothetical protein